MTVQQQKAQPDQIIEDETTDHDSRHQQSLEEQKVIIVLMFSHTIIVAYILNSITLTLGHADVTFCCRQSFFLHPDMYDSILLGCAFITPSVFCMSISCSIASITDSR